ncbi:MAG TPA: dihydroorotate dehydrogenase electron transfer subunit [Anaerolineae bacterium]|nr:dihydroorotate dehydrogenase electron transfer subunit [Anaerolineae bacterium]
MQEYTVGILRTECLDNTTYLIELSCEEIAHNVKPGQFIQVKVGSGTDPFLRRTLSVCGADPKRAVIKLLVDVVGHGTALLCEMKRGGLLNIIGILGKGFDIEAGGNGSCVLVAGGIGAAPLLFLAERFTSIGKRKVTFMIGAETSASLKVFESLITEGVTVMSATDDGSSGFYGKVSELFEKNIEIIRPKALYTCGPHAMMKEIARVAELWSIPCQVSLEERMACGIGVCLGCAVRLRNGRMVRSCVEGPVFYTSEVVL